MKTGLLIMKYGGDAPILNFKIHFIIIDIYFGNLLVTTHPYMCSVGSNFLWIILN
jgi:hypothetical protein